MYYRKTASHLGQLEEGATIAAVTPEAAAEGGKLPLFALFGVSVAAGVVVWLITSYLGRKG